LHCQISLRSSVSTMKNRKRDGINSSKECFTAETNRQILKMNLGIQLLIDGLYTSIITTQFTMSSEEKKPQKHQLSKTQRNKKQFIAVAKLKLQVKHPELVEFHDVNSPNPLLLNELKSIKNTVPIPEHWHRKKQYLTKRMERDLYELPEYIKATGVSELRQAYLEKEKEMNLKQKMRERVRPKQVGCIDYETLYNAFFNNDELKKCEMTPFGELYHDEKGKRLEGTPFHLSSELREALGIGENEEPPWAAAMAKYGLPPAYAKIIASQKRTGGE